LGLNPSPIENKHKPTAGYITNVMDEDPNMTDSNLSALAALATSTHASEYAASGEQFTYCLSLIGMSASARGVDEVVNHLEDLFDALNA
jgi:hypothetical protein